MNSNIFRIKSIGAVFFKESSLKKWCSNLQCLQLQRVKLFHLRLSSLEAANLNLNIKKCLVSCLLAGSVSAGGEESQTTTVTATSFVMFKTIDEAAVHLLHRAALSTIRDPLKKERGGDVKQHKNGFYYVDRIEVGTNDSVSVSIGSETVAIAHTHPPKHYSSGGGLLVARINDRHNNQKISSADRNMVYVANRFTGRKLPTYVGSSDGTVTKFTASTGYRSAILVAPVGTLLFKNTIFVDQENTLSSAK